MPKGHFTGLGNSEGIKGFKPYDPGKYVVECEDWQEEERDGMTLVKIKTSILDGPDQKDGREIEGKGYTWMITIPDESHPSYNDDWYEGAIGELKAALDGFGVPVDGDSYDGEDAIGKSAKLTLGVQKPSKKQKEKGYDEPTNTVRKAEPDSDVDAAEAYED